MSPTIAAAAEQAEQLKENGNHCFQRNKFSAAIDFYTEAITLCPNVPVYWTNRALCHRRRNDWLRLEEDCRRAIQLDHNSVKALDLGRGADPKSYMIEEIWQELGNAKYLEWEHESTSRSWKQQNLKESCETAFKKKYLLDSSEAEGSSDEKINHLAEQLEALNLVFKKAAEDDTPTEVPDYLCCKITLDIFRDPVITPSGVTYERAVILNHLQKVGNFDPITREPLNTCQLIPNLAIKEAVQSYLAKHGWAYRTD
ncbi:PREDICTED: E3 ubiquitin-protein ligase CHIP-like isoform X2 [Ipomoea nil]|uniref:E3 ubiquitin-protein ligase CHIP-like isoform X2 n=1 Tax=Ipomoea nil TaxID=35883 RepID=UPI000901A8F4|nr:PREDICTED: E3 ubiquitin-protein ligase CHIP-like isoform X2 [Ipomoea nil]